MLTVKFYEQIDNKCVFITIGGYFLSVCVCLVTVRGYTGKLFWSLFLKIIHSRAAFQNLIFNRCQVTV